MENINKLLLQLNEIVESLPLSAQSDVKKRMNNGLRSDDAFTKFDTFMVVRDKAVAMRDYKVVQDNHRLYHACLDIVCLCNEVLIYYAARGVGRHHEVVKHEGCFDNVLELENSSDGK